VAAAGHPAGPGRGLLEAAVGDAGAGGRIPALDRKPRALPAHLARPGLSGRTRTVAAQLLPRGGYRRLPRPAPPHQAAAAYVQPRRVVARHPGAGAGARDRWRAQRAACGSVASGARCWRAGAGSVVAGCTAGTVSRSTPSTFGSFHGPLTW